MARVVNTKIDKRVREIVAEQFATLSGDLRARDKVELSSIFGVQPKTLEGWTEGRGSPAPKATEGHFLLDGTIPQEWSDRIIAGLALRGGLFQSGIMNIQRDYQDTIGDATLADCLDRVKDFLTRNTGDNWFDSNWRNLKIHSLGNGVFQLWVTYTIGISDQDEAL